MVPIHAAVWVVQVVEDMLSKSGDMGLQTAKAITDAAMLEVSKINESHMVGCQHSNYRGSGSIVDGVRCGTCGRRTFS